MTYASAVWVTCDLCYKSHGATVDRDNPADVKRGYEEAGARARQCDHVGGAAL